VKKRSEKRIKNNKKKLNAAFIKLNKRSGKRIKNIKKKLN